MNRVASIIAVVVGIFLGAVPLKAVSSEPTECELTETAVTDLLQDCLRPGTASSRFEDFLKVFGLAKKSRNYALVVSISDYDANEEWINLETKRDPIRMRNYLLTEGGFDRVWVVTGKNVTHGRLRTLLEDTIPQEIGKQDRFLFYWSGHGVTRPRGNSQQGYLALKESTPGEYSSMISMADILKWDENIDADQVLYLLDSCFSGHALAQAKTGLSRDELTREKISAYMAPARHMLTAGKSDEVAIVDTRVGSVFTTAILSGLRDGLADDYSPEYGQDKVISFEELSSYVVTKTKELAGNIDHKDPLTPQSSRFKYEGGSFIFPRMSIVADPNTEFPGLKETKTKLAALGFQPGDINDNRLSFDTQAALIAFQRKYQLDRTGRPDRLTVPKIIEVHRRIYGSADIGPRGEELSVPGTTGGTVQQKSGQQSETELAIVTERASASEDLVVNRNGDRQAEDLGISVTGGTEIDLPEGVTIDLAAGPASHTLSKPVFSDDGSRLAVMASNSSESAGLVVYDAERTSVLSQMTVEGQIGSISFSKDSNFLAVGIQALTDGELPWVSRIELRRADDLSLVRKFSGVDDVLGRVASLTFSPDGARISAAASYASATYAIWRVSDGKRLFVGKTAGKRTNTVKFSPDGSKLLAVGSEPLSWQIVDAANGHPGPKLDLSAVDLRHSITPHFSADSKRIFAQIEFSLYADPNSSIGEWSLSDGRLMRRFGDLAEREDRLLGVSFESDRLAMMAGDGSIRFLRASDGSVSDTVFLEGATTRDVALTGDLKKVALPYGYGVRVLELPSGNLIADIPHLASGVASVAFNADGRMLAMGLDRAYEKRVPAAEDSKYKFDMQAYRAFGVWNWATGEPAFVDNAENNIFENAGGLDWHTDKPWLAVAGKGGNLTIFRTNNFEIVKKFDPSPEGSSMASYDATALSFVPEHNLVLSGHGHGGIGVWDTETGAFVRAIPGDAFAVSRQGDKIATIDLHFGSVRLESSKLALFDAKSGNEIWSVDQGGNVPRAVAFSREGDRIVGLISTKSGENQDWPTRLAIWRESDGKVLASFGEFGDFANLFALSTDGRFAAVARKPDQTIEIWNIDERRKVQTLHLPNAEASSLDFAPDGRFLAVGTRPAQVYVFQLDSTKIVGQFALYADGTASFVDNRLQLSDQRLIGRVHAYLGGNSYASIQDLRVGSIPAATRESDVAFLSAAEAMARLKSGDEVLRRAIIEERARQFDSDFRRRVQRILADDGQYSGEIDGIFGPNTLHGLSRYVQAD